MMLWYWSTVFLISIHGYQAQQTYNRQLDCNKNSTTASGYTCNGAAASCLSYLTFRSQPPLYNTTSSIAALLNSTQTLTTSPPSTTSPPTPPTQSSSFRSVTARAPANGTSTTRITFSKNAYKNIRDFSVGDDVTVPIRCACPTASQRAAGVRVFFDANELTASDYIVPFTPILIPVTTTPTRINVSVAQVIPVAPPPPPPVVPVAPPPPSPVDSVCIIS
ncbi:hypothetical protein SSX86_033188 [Deinandra increscens subsp. villosa]|uniref:Uncharacterized protein n=1 Tax=Deinandra increscens subsp. villosa TaxID=3103831 RepID=A0AAP0GH00_9ASTR